MKIQKIHSPPFAGIPTFAKFPTTDWKSKNDGNKAYVVVGVPYDMGTTDYPGARLAPRKIRDASTQFAYTSSHDLYGFSDSQRGFYNIEENKVIFKKYPCYDIGDIEIVAGEPGKTFDYITETVTSLISKNIVPIVLGGDHAITFPILRGFDSTSSITVLHFDAHMDFWNPSRNSIYDHSCSMWSISRLKNISHIYQFGIRGLNHSSDMVKEAKKNKVSIITANEILKKGEKVIRSLPITQNIYISIDIDFFDPSIAPGTGTREIGGLFYQHFIQLLKRLTRHKNLIGVDLVEVNPFLDHSGITSLLAARTLLDTVGFFN